MDDLDRVARMRAIDDFMLEEIMADDRDALFDCLSDAIALIGTQADADEPDEKAVEKAAEQIVALVRSYAGRINDEAVKRDLEGCADDLEGSADCGLAEVQYCMGRLYDSFDYWRILVQHPAQAMSAGTAETACPAQGESPPACSATPMRPEAV